MAVITVGTTGATWGTNTQTGIITQSQGAKVSREQNIVRNATGDATLWAFYNPKQTHTVAGVIIGNTGIAAAAPGVALTLAGANTANGVSGGGIYTTDVDVTTVNTDFSKITVNADQYPGIA